MNSALRIAPSFTLRLLADFRVLSYVRLVLRRSLPTLDETTDALFFGAVTEVVSNAISAQLEAAPEDPLAVHVQLSEAPIIQVCDTGNGFDPENPDLETSNGAGFGLQIVRSVIPGLKIESSSMGTSVLLPYPMTTP